MDLTPVPLLAPKDKVMPFFQEKHAEGLALLKQPTPADDPEDVRLFYSVQDLYKVVFKAIHKAFPPSRALELIGRLNIPVVPDRGDPNWRSMTTRERLQHHVLFLESLVELLVATPD